MTLIRRYLSWVRAREANRPGIRLCGYLGCGEYARRMAWNRLGSLIPACADRAHGRDLVL